MIEFEKRQHEVTERERHLKQVVLSLADAIANIAHTESELEVPNEETASALGDAISFVEALFSSEEMTLEFLREAQMIIENSLDTLSNV